jgi:hypothetical protein
MEADGLGDIEETLEELTLVMSDVEARLDAIEKSTALDAYELSAPAKNRQARKSIGHSKAELAGSRERARRDRAIEPSPRFYASAALEKRGDSELESSPLWVEIHTLMCVDSLGHASRRVSRGAVSATVGGENSAISGGVRGGSQAGAEMKVQDVDNVDDKHVEW